MGSPIHIDLGNVGDLAKPLTKLIDAIVKGTGLAPLGTILQAKADRDAKIIEAKGNISVATLNERAQVRIEYREELRQKNIETISNLAAQELPDSVSSKPVEQDWILQYFDYAQDVCDEDIQSIWARILAGEVASPGTYTKRTLQFLKTIEKEDATKFSEFCAFAFTWNDGWHHIVQNEQTSEEIHKKLGAGSTGDYISHFQSIGLILPNPYLPAASSLTGFTFNYFGKKYIFRGPPKPPENQPLELQIPLLAFSQIGQQLAKIARAQPISGYVERLSQNISETLKVFLDDDITFQVMEPSL